MVLKLRLLRLPKFAIPVMVVILDTTFGMRQNYMQQ